MELLWIAIGSAVRYSSNRFSIGFHFVYAEWLSFWSLPCELPTGLLNWLPFAANLPWLLKGHVPQPASMIRTAPTVEAVRLLH